jgi:hypothetical protein
MWEETRPTSPVPSGLEKRREKDPQVFGKMEKLRQILMDIQVFKA